MLVNNLQSVVNVRNRIYWLVSEIEILSKILPNPKAPRGHRTEMRNLFQSARRRSTAEKILGLLAESGFIYFSVNVRSSFSCFQRRFTKAPVCQVLNVIIILVTPTTYGAGDVIATVSVTIIAFVGVRFRNDSPCRHVLIPSSP